MKIRRRQVVDMTLRGGHGPHTADWRATRDKETLEVDMSEDWVDVVEARHAAEAEVERLRRELEGWREGLRVELGRGIVGYSIRVSDEIARLDAILQGDNHE